MSALESFLPLPERPRILVDSKEARGAPRIVERLKKLGAEVAIGALPVGDYVISGECAVERKRVQDFALSITRRRVLFDQAIALKQAYSRPVILIEGYMPSIYRFSQIRPIAIWAAVFTLIKMGIYVVSTLKQSETAEFLYAAARREQLAERRVPSVRAPKRAETLAEKQLFLVAGLPHVDRTLGERLLEHFGSPRRLFAASPEELLRVRGIGKKIAEEITEVLDRPYRSSFSPPDPTSAG